jgi:hypothetical protein
MNTIVLYLIQIAVTALICFGVIVYFRRHLRRILVDICRTEDRADFWLAFSSIFLVGWPVVIGMGYNPTAKVAEVLFFDAASQIRSNLAGFLIAFFGVGCVIAFFALVAPRTPVQADRTGKLEATK